MGIHIRNLRSKAMIGARRSQTIVLNRPDTLKIAYSNESARIGAWFVPLRPSRKSIKFDTQKMQILAESRALHNPFGVVGRRGIVTRGSGSRRNPGLYYTTRLALPGWWRWRLALRLPLPLPLPLEPGGFLDGSRWLSEATPPVRRANGTAPRRGARTGRDSRNVHY